MEKQQAQNYLEEVLKDKFDLETFELFARNLLNEYELKGSDYSGSRIPEKFRNHIAHYRRIGKYTDPEGEVLEIVAVQVRATSKLERTRTALRNFVVHHLKNVEQQFALVAFYAKEDQGADWRLSLVKIEYETERNEQGKIKTTEELVPAKRFSFLVGEYEDCYTAQKQLLPLLTNDYSNPLILKEKDGDGSLEGAFSVEKVTDEFYEQYRELYLWLVEQPELVASLNQENLAPERFVKKLLGQIVFLYFLQKKGWLGVNKEDRMGEGSKRFLQKRFGQVSENGKNYFNDFLRHLFYAALAREHHDEGIPYYFQQLDCKIPFLNGGLFEAEYGWEQARLNLPNELFRNDQKNKAGDRGTGILDVFDRYNFTIKEDEPLEREVAVDPEMLGKVFEKMLKKGNGAFYTPRDIVHYMCQESLVHYLNNLFNSSLENYQTVSDSQLLLVSDNINSYEQKTFEQPSVGPIQIPEETIENFIRYGHEVSESEAKYIDQALADIKICDPAVGSGTFIVGLLQEIVAARLKLNSIMQQVDSTVYSLKRHAIQESVYGMDIDATAIDIAQLRLWLSLIVDEEDHEAIDSLPNLNYKITCNDSLVGSKKDIDVERGKLKSQLEKARKQFVFETNTINKSELRTRIASMTKQLAGSIKRADSFAAEVLFSEVWSSKGGFDIVIGNPPSVTVPSEKYSSLYSPYYELTEGKPVLDRIFVERGMQLHNRKGVISYILPSTILTIPSAQMLRQRVLDKYWLSTLVNLDYPVFKNSSIDSIIIIVNSIKKTRKISCLTKKRTEFNETSEVETQQVSPSVWRANPKSEWRIFVNSETAPIIDEVNKTNTTIADLKFQITLGIQAYHNSLHSEEQIKSEFLHCEDQKDEGYHLELGGKDISQYFVTIPEKKSYLNFAKPLYNAPDIKFFRQPKAVISEVIKKKGKEIACGYTEDFLLFKKSCYIVIHDEKDYLKYITAILNSQIIVFYVRLLGDKSKQRKFPRVTMTTLKRIPIPQTQHYKIFAKLVDYVITLGTGENAYSLFFKELLNSIAFELYMYDEFKSSKKEMIRHLDDIKPIASSISGSRKIAIIQSEFERLYNPNHPVRNSLETINNIEKVRIIQEAIK